MNRNSLQQRLVLITFAALASTGTLALMVPESLAASGLA